jgi:hypothetical protein
MNRKYGSAIPEDGAVMALDGFTGAEIEQIAKDSLFDGLDEAMKNIVPLSRTTKEQVNALREWARTRARAANLPEALPTEIRRSNWHKEDPMAKMTPLERSLLEDLECLLEEIIDAEQHLNPETSEVYLSILVLCRKVLTINTRFGRPTSSAVKSVASL